VERTAEADAPHGADDFDRDDPDRLRRQLRLHHDADADPAKITTMFLTLSDNRYVILMCINVMLLLLGTVMDMAPLILILTPILMPVITGIGVDPVQFGMIMLVNLGIG
jgi:hypothetical protein